MKYIRVQLTAEELRTLYHFHRDIADDEWFCCKTDHTEEAVRERKKRARLFKKALAKEFKEKV